MTITNRPRTNSSAPGHQGRSGRQRPPVPKVADIVRAVTDGEPAVRITAYDGSAVGPADAPIGLHVVSERGLSYLLTAPGDLGMARAYVSGDLEVRGVHPGDPYEALRQLTDGLKMRLPAPGEALRLVRGLGWERLRPRRRRPSRRGGARSRDCGTPRAATPRRFITTTTCRTRSTSRCSARQ